MWRTAIAGCSRYMVGIVVMVAGFGAATGTTAVADAPVLAAEDFEWTYEVESPCSGDIIAVTEVADVYEHIHQNNFVSQPDIEVAVSDGFDGRALDIGVETHTTGLANHRVMLTNWSSGERFELVTFIVFVDGSPLVESYSARCISG